MWVRGLKQIERYHIRAIYRSHPMWVRGLKHNPLIGLVIVRVSHPMWVRGLKHPRKNLPRH